MKSPMAAIPHTSPLRSEPAAIVGLLAITAALFAAGPQTVPPESTSIRVRCHGKLRHGIAAIGGETTGTTISTDGITWELMLPNDDVRAFARDHHKEHVTAVGSLRQVRGTEIPVRWIVDVEKLILADQAANQKGIDVMIKGTLQSKDAPLGQPPQMMIESQKVVWPIDCSAKSDLSAKGETLIGKPVQLIGKLELDKESQATPQPIVRVEKLDVPPDRPAAKKRSAPAGQDKP